MRLYSANRVILFLVITLFYFNAAAMPEFSTRAPYAVAMDYNTGAVLFDKKAREPMHPSSMTKLMTLYILFDRIKKGELSLETKLPVSENAWRKGGSKMFVKVGSEVSVVDLIRGIAVQSGNDACIVVAEAISGTEEAFAEEMNRTAQRLGMTGSYFKNSTGWPDPEHYMTAYDLAIITSHLLSDFRDYYHYFSEKSFTYNGIKQYNRNTLVGKQGEIDGLKTGHTEDGGYGIVISGVEHSNSPRRTIVVVNGLASEKEREIESYMLFNYVMRSFRNILFYEKGEEVAEAEVWMGEEEKVPLVSGDNIVFTLSRVEPDKLEVKVVYDGPLQAPIVKGDKVAEIHISKPGEAEGVFPLYAGKDVEEKSFFGRIGASAEYYFSGR